MLAVRSAASGCRSMVRPFRPIVPMAVAVALFAAAVCPERAASQFGPAPYGSAPGVQYTPPLTAGQAPFCASCPPDATVKELLPPREGFFEGRARLAPAAQTAFDAAWVRFDYLHYTFSEPGAVPVGAPIPAPVAGDVLTSPEEAVIFPTTEPGFPALARAFDLGGFNLDDVSGARVTLGLPTEVGDFELAAWGFEQGGNSLDEVAVNTPDGVFFLLASPLVTPSIPLLANGVPSVNAAAVVDRLQVGLRSELFGSKIDFVLPERTPNQLLTIRPVIGFQYFRFREDYSIRGFVDDDFATVVLNPDGSTGPLIDPFVRTADARVDNHIFGPTIAARFDLGNEWLRLGVEPKFGLGINRRLSRASSSQLGGPTDVFSFDETEDTDLEPYFEVNAYVRGRLTKRLSLFFGYNFLAFNGIGRPQSSTQFNSIGVNDAEVTVTNNQENLIVHGLMVGGEIILGRVN